MAELKKTRKFLAGIDSDGCAFDNMEVKHRQCFTPATIEKWGLQSIAPFAEEVTYFINLYSKHRGVNRFLALVMTMDMLSRRRAVAESGFRLPDIRPLRQWTASGDLSAPALEKALGEKEEPVLRRTLDWSNAINDKIARLGPAPPFAYVKESLRAMAEQTDILVVSSANAAAVKKEWEEHNLAPFASMLGGQEYGPKADVLRRAKAQGYDDDATLMIGDAPGDLKAARANNVLFYPVIPGKESECWQIFREEALSRFIQGNYAGAYQEKLLDEFTASLPSEPPWEQTG